MLKEKKSGPAGTRNKYRDHGTDAGPDYRDPISLARYISDAGKITPARISKSSINQQKKVAGAIKKARNIALIPNGMDAYDHFSRVEPISPVPFEV